MTPRVKALLQQLNSGKLKTDMARILHYIKNHPYCTLPEIERQLNLKHQTASARISDLQDLGLVEDHGSKKTSTSCFSCFKFQPDFKKQSLNAKARKTEKYKNWVNKGLTQFEEFINPQLKQQLLCK